MTYSMLKRKPKNTFKGPENLNRGNIPPHRQICLLAWMTLSMWARHISQASWKRSHSSTSQHWSTPSFVLSPAVAITDASEEVKRKIKSKVPQNTSSQWCHREKKPFLTAACDRLKPQSWDFIIVMVLVQSCSCYELLEEKAGNPILPRSHASEPVMGLKKTWPLGFWWYFYPWRMEIS